MAICCARILEIFFGVISPNKMMRTVRTAVPTETKPGPKYPMIRAVDREDADRLTTLLQIRIADSILLY